MKTLSRLICTTTAVCSLALTGCNTAPKRTAGETLRAAVDKSFKEDKNYNFSITQQISLTPSANKQSIAIEDAGYKALEQEAGKSAKQSRSKSIGKTMDDCDDDFDAAIANKSLSEKQKDKAADVYVACLKTATDASPADKSLYGSAGKMDERIKKVMTPQRINAINEYWLKPLTMQLNGAVDANSKRVLMDYRLAYQPKNFTLAMNFPMLFDFDEMSISIDTALALPFLGPIFDKDIGTSWNGKWIKFTLPEEIKKEIPTELVLSSLMQALQMSYNGIDDKYISFADKSDLSRDLNAHHAIKLDLPPKQQLLLVDRVLSNWVTVLDKEAAANPQAISNPKVFNKFLGMAKEMTKNGLLSSEMGDMANSSEFLSLMGESDYTFFMNGNDRIVGMLNTQKMTALADLINADLSSRSVMTITNHNRADFSMVPSRGNIIDGNAFIEKFVTGDVDNPFKPGKKKSKKKYKSKTDTSYTKPAPYNEANYNAEAARDTATEAANAAAAEPVSDIASAPTALMMENDVLVDEAAAPELNDAQQRDATRRAFCQTNPQFAKSKTCQALN